MRNQNSKGHFSVHRMMLNNCLFEDATEIGLWVKFASEFAWEECEVIGQFTGKPIKLVPNQQVFSTKQLTQLLNGVWPGTKSGKKQLTRHMVNGRMDRWKEAGIIGWIDCECTTDGRIFTIKTARPNVGNPETGSETKPAAPNIKKNNNKNKEFVPPTHDALVSYAKEKLTANPQDWLERPHGMIDEFLAFYNGTDWCTAKGDRLKDWRHSLCRWNNNRRDKSPIKAGKRTSKSSYTPAGPEALIASDTAAANVKSE
jgi:hypothetical protein